jgi:hypothetical protein
VAAVQPLRDYTVQFTADNLVIEEYSYYLTVTNNPGGMDDQDVVLLRPQLRYATIDYVVFE